MKILLIDDDPNIYHLINSSIESEDELIYLKDYTDLKNEILRHDPHVILLDIYIEDKNALDSLYTNRAFLEKLCTPIFLISVDDSLKSKIQAFNFGVDDYIIKPFEPIELIARVKSRVRKNQKQENNYSFGDVLIHLDSHLIVVDNLQVSLTKNEFDLLCFMSKNLGRILTREQILDKIWGHDFLISDRVIDQLVSRLRKKIKSKTHSIKACYGQGYSIEKL